ncbi:MAG: DUF2062 domain-containing protein [Candidatus Omnitrophica bacterium]|nr:DUF2062 domain-containing protein [Candidatus Omnitrophota bacterium]
MRWLKLIYLKLFRINDSPQKVAIGLGLGVFFGIMPGLGPLAALFFAFLFRVNRAAALLGSVLTNTWLSIPTFVLAVKAGFLITGISYKNFGKNWLGIASIIIGYITVSLCVGVLAYLAALIIIISGRKSKIML